MAQYTTSAITVLSRMFNDQGKLESKPGRLIYTSSDDQARVIRVEGTLFAVRRDPTASNTLTGADTLNIGGFVYRVIDCAIPPVTVDDAVELITMSI